MSADRQLVKILHRRSGELLDERQLQRRREGLDEFSGEDERELGRHLIHQVVAAHRAQLVEAGQEPLSREDESELTAAVFAAQFGAGSLQKLLDEDDVEEIQINGHDVVWVQRADGSREQVPPVAADDDELVRMVRNLGSHAGLSARAWDSANPRIRLRLPDGSRLTGIMENTTRPSVAIRKHRYTKVTLDDLVANQTLSREVADFLGAAVRAGMNIIVAGDLGSGKTTLLRALAREFGPLERVFTIETERELAFDDDPGRFPNLVVMEESPPNSEGLGGFSMSELVRTTLSMTPDRIIVGEVRGDEIIDMLTAMTQGNAGSLSTIHGLNARMVFNRILTYAVKSKERLPFEATAMLTAGALDFIVYIEEDKSGTIPADRSRRTVRTILEVGDADGAKISGNEIFDDIQGTGEAVRLDVKVSKQRELALTRAGWNDPMMGGRFS